MSSRSSVSLSIGLPLMAILDQQYLISSSTYLIHSSISSLVSGHPAITNIHHRASKGHTGSYLAARISECLHEYEIQDKVSINEMYGGVMLMSNDAHRFSHLPLTMRPTIIHWWTS